MKDDGEIRDDIKIPEGDVGKEIQTKFEASEDFMVTILSAMGQEAAIATKAMTKWRTNCCLMQSFCYDCVFVMVDLLVCNVC